MFLDYYKLREQPFGDTPDPHFAYFGKTHCEALASLWYGLQADRGFLVLVAPPGMGKTTLLCHLLHRLRGSARTAFLFQTECDSLQLLRYLLLDLGVRPGADMVSMHEQLNEILLVESRAGKRVVFVVDEAQNLATPVLETLRLLSDFETSQRKLLQIILVGQPRLARTLSSPELQQLKQRISTFSWLENLNAGEVAGYVRHRLQVAGHSDGSLFSRHALELIAKESDGIPRNINNLCFSALTEGFALGKHTIEREIVEEVVTNEKLTWLRAKDDAPPPNQASPSAEPVFQPVTRTPRIPSRRIGLPRYATFAASFAVLIGVVLTPASYYRARSEPHVQFSSRSQPGVPSQIVGARVSTDAGRAATSIAVVAPAPPTAFGPLAEDGVVVVESRQDLRQICLHYLGRYDPELIEAIQRFNPLLVDPNHIFVGQRLRLPVDKIHPRRPPLRNGGSSNALTIALGNRHE